MRFFINSTLNLSLQRRKPGYGRQCALAAGVALLLAACGGSQNQLLGSVEGFLGGVAADEPRAALIGREVLSSGGTAADAAVAMYFAMSVTLPSAANPGGGGICLVQDRPSGRTQALEFLPRQGAADVAIPGNLRGMFALHAKYGRLRWASLVAPAESLARFGERVSRALARDLALPEAARLAEDGESRRIFARDGERLVQEGDVLRQLDLAALLTQIRTNGPGDFYAGGLARMLAANSQGALSVADLRAMQPRWLETLKLPHGNQTLHFAPTAGGVLSAQIWALLGEAGSVNKEGVFVDMRERALAGRASWLDADGRLNASPESLIVPSYIEKLSRTVRPPSASSQSADGAHSATLVAMDREGSAVTCSFTMNGAFGSGRTVSGTGLILAAAPSFAAVADMAAPVLLVNPHVNEFFYAGAASGGRGGLSALLQISSRTLIDALALDAALEASRTSPGEQGRVNAAYCPGGLPVKPASCAVRTDPQGFGLAASADQ